MGYNRHGPPVGGGMGLMMLMALYSVTGLVIGLVGAVAALLLTAFSPLRWGMVAGVLVVVGMIAIAIGGGLDVPLDTNRALGAAIVRQVFTHHRVDPAVMMAAWKAGIGPGLMVAGAILAAWGAGADVRRAQRAAGGGTYGR